MLLDTRLNFSENIKIIIPKSNKAVGLLRKLHYVLLSPSLHTIYKLFVRPHLDNGDIEWNKLGPKIQISESTDIFKQRIVTFV